MSHGDQGHDGSNHRDKWSEILEAHGPWINVYGAWMESSKAHSLYVTVMYLVYGALSSGIKNCPWHLSWILEHSLFVENFVMFNEPSGLLI